ncbi:MAG: hypothetical protein RG741_02875 [Bacteroidales bacterium]|nr:hypothetical protein [Bacteroidales bacterium]
MPRQGIASVIGQSKGAQRCHHATVTTASGLSTAITPVKHRKHGQQTRIIDKTAA